MTEQQLGDIEARARSLANTDRVILGQIVREDVPALIAHIRAQSAELAERDETFDLHWRAEMRGVEAWRHANPGNDLVLPDTGHLTTWLLDQWQAAERRAQEWRDRARVISEIGTGLH